MGELADTYRKYPNIGTLLPAMGYGPRQMADLEATIAACPCDLVLVATPIDLSRVVRIRQPHMRVLYELDEQGTGLIDSIEKAIAAHRGKVMSK